MLTSEIQAFAFKANLNAMFAGRRAHVIVALPKDGKDFYVGRDGLTEDMAEAMVYRYDDHGVAEQCEQVILTTGNKPKVVEVCPTAWRQERKVVTV